MEDMSTRDVHFQNVAKRFRELLDITQVEGEPFSEEEGREMKDICTIIDAFQMAEYRPAGGIDDMYRNAVDKLKKKIVKIKDDLEQRNEQLNQYEKNRLDAVNYFLSVGDTKGDVVHKYRSKSEVEFLKRKGYLKNIENEF